jgi:hypothetical protein
MATKIGHVGITLKIPRHRPLNLYSSVVIEETDKTSDLLVRAKAALVTSLSQHHESRYCDASFALDDKEFLATMKKVLAFRVRKTHLCGCDCDPYGLCMGWEEAQAAKARILTGRKTFKENKRSSDAPKLVAKTDARHTLNAASVSHEHLPSWATARVRKRVP